MLIHVRDQAGSGRRAPAFASRPAAPSPRKQPVQHRSRTTVDAILTATFQVLADGGPAALTTTRVAEVAGVSIGTLYQYFPNKQALVAGLLTEHLKLTIDAIERAAIAAAGEPLAVQVDRVVRALLAIKRERVPISLAMQPALVEIDERPIVRAATHRGAAIVARLLAGGAEPDAETLQRAVVLGTALEGIIASTIAEDPRRLEDPAFAEQLVALAIGGATPTSGPR
jgi:AcrR family transcriptional regulator